MCEDFNKSAVRTYQDKLMLLRKCHVTYAVLQFNCLPAQSGDRLDRRDTGSWLVESHDSRVPFETCSAFSIVTKKSILTGSSPDSRHGSPHARNAHALNTPSTDPCARYTKYCHLFELIDSSNSAPPSGHPNDQLAARPIQKRQKCRADPWMLGAC